MSSDGPKESKRNVMDDGFGQTLLLIVVFVAAVWNPFYRTAAWSLSFFCGGGPRRAYTPFDRRSMYQMQVKTSCMVRIATTGMYFPGTTERAVLVAGNIDGVKVNVAACHVVYARAMRQII